MGEQSPNKDREIKTAAHIPAPRRRLWVPQVRLITLLLLTACVAVWWGTWIARSEAARLQIELARSQPLARELAIKDRTQLSVIRQDEKFYDENVWQVYVPREGMNIHVATKEIDLSSSASQTLPPESSAQLRPGQHTVELKIEPRGTHWLVSVLVDLEVVIEVVKEQAWNSNKGSSGGGLCDRQTDFDQGQAAILFKRRFSDDWTLPKPKEPTRNGVMMWID